MFWSKLLIRLGMIIHYTVEENEWYVNDEDG